MAVEVSDDDRPRYLRIDPMPFRKECVRTWANRALAPTCQVRSDGLSAFSVLAEEVLSHEAIVTGSGRKAAQDPRFRWVNVMLSNLKTAISGTYHAFRFAKYAHRYLTELQYRFNRRFNLVNLFYACIRDCTRTPPQPEPRLRLG